jgi:hypothetical protein
VTLLAVSNPIAFFNELRHFQPFWLKFGKHGERIVGASTQRPTAKTPEMKKPALSGFDGGTTAIWWPGAESKLASHPVV